MNPSLTFIVKPADPEHADIITGFQLSMAIETENLHLNREVTTKGVKAVFKDPGKGKYYIAIAGDIVIGSLLTTPEWSDWRNRYILWIQSVYVRPEYRGKGVFKALYSNLKEEVMAEEGFGGLRLYVDKTNLLAQEVYSRSGMDGEHYQVFEWMK